MIDLWMTLELSSQALWNNDKNNKKETKNKKIILSGSSEEWMGQIQVNSGLSEIAFYGEMSSSTGNAFTNPSSGKIDQQRKILEELEKKKKQINQSSSSSSSIVVVAGNNSTTTQSQSPTIVAGVIDSSPVLSNNQRTAMEVATKSSFGYFVPQDSSFGNLILPVIPRINN